MGLPANKNYLKKLILFSNFLFVGAFKILKKLVKLAHKTFQVQNLEILAQSSIWSLNLGFIQAFI